MMDNNIENLSTAINDFQRARSQADMKQLLARITGESTKLLSYDEVRRQVRAIGNIERGLHDIPVDAIVGSVDRYTDFTRDFLPRQEVNPDRWARVKVATNTMEGLPPIEVYQIGEVYFVNDGNHRVSVARQMGSTHIQAYVTEVHSRVPLTPDIQPDDLIIKAEQSNFLEITRMDQLRPDADLTITAPGKYQNLLEHIEVHRYFMGLDQQRDIAYEEAVTHWYDTVYLPLVVLIREMGILHAFPDRTETDLYLWIAEHRAALESELGWDIETEYAASDLAEHFSPETSNIMSRIGGRLLNLIVPGSTENGSSSVHWRAQAATSRTKDRLFTDILVPLSGEASSWNALDQALIIAPREKAQLRGLHIVPSEEDIVSPEALDIQTEFEQRCSQAGVEGRLAIVAGEVNQEICRRSVWADLVVANLKYPPSPQPLARLSSGYRTLIKRCPRPILATPQTSTQLNRALLAYDGSAKAKEALCVATYLAGQWGIPLIVVSILEQSRVTQDTLTQARDYLLENGVEATTVQESGPVAQTILQVSETYSCDFMIMGGYGHSPVMDVVLGSSVDQVLRESRKPMLICR